MNERDIFDAALAIDDPAQRAAYLDSACAGNPGLRGHIDGLLSVHGQVGSFLESPAPALVATINDPLTERPGTVIGPYKLLQQIGEGGMGTVFMAEQTQPVRRKVALKVIKQGMDTRQVIARFEAERQALAMMDHLNIARVLDVGATDTGRPYFVMELVHGVPITKYCDDNHLTPRERLELFVPVCQAIQHAHQKGIIHRDIKPSNVMVTLYDGKPVPKVIDFGVAKAIEQKLTERTMFTQYGTIVGTLEYMSPEQAEMSGLGVDTRGDIYSLGVLLYELLTGSTPLERPRLREAAYAEVLRLIREEEAPKPSARLSSSDTLPAIAAARKTEPAKLARLVRGELDWIVMKALEKDRTRRYETASGFAADVQHYLDDEAVQACPPSAWYRFRKFARRNKAALTTAVLIALFLILGAGALAVGYLRIREAQERTLVEKEQTKVEYERAEQNLHLALQSLDEMYTDLAEKGLANEPHMEPLRQKYLEKALAFYQKFARENTSDATVRAETAKAYSRVADILSRLGRPGEAEEVYQQAVARCEELVANPATAHEGRSELARSLMNLAVLLRNTGRPKHAVETYNRVQALLADLLAEIPTEPKYRHQLASCLLNRAAAFDDMRELPEAEKAAHDGLGLLQKLTEESPAVAGYKMDLALGLTSLSAILNHSKRIDEAKKALVQAGDLLAKLPEGLREGTQYRRQLGSIHSRLGTLLASARRPREAEPAYRQALLVQTRLAADFPATFLYRKDLIKTCGQLGRVLNETGRAEEGLALHEKLVADFPLQRDYKRGLIGYLNDLGVELRLLRRFKEAESFMRRSLILQEKHAPEFANEPGYSWEWALGRYNLGALLALTGRSAEAEKSFRQAIAHQKELLAKFAAEPVYQLVETAKRVRTAADGGAVEAPRTPDYRGLLAMSYLGLARMFQDAGRFEEADKSYHEGLEAVPDSSKLNNELAWFRATCRDPRFRDPAEAVQRAKKAVELARQNGDYWSTLGTAYYRAGKWKQCCAALAKSMELRKGGDSFDWFFLGMAHWQLNQRVEARKWYDQAVQWMEKNKPQDEELRRFRTEAAELLEVKDKKKE